jgi:monofunctional biosynthetic peptidoglycan transglycosylase
MARRKKKKYKVYLKNLFKIVMILFLLTTLPVLFFRWVEPPFSSFMLQNRFKAWRNNDRHYQLKYQWVDRENISPNLMLAVIAAEDQKFPDHMGFDFESIGRAIKERINGTNNRGASTITQQVAKNLFLWPGRSFLRKGIEAYFALLIEFFWGKTRILEVYVNIAQFGKGVFGVAEASRIFYGKSPKMLSPYESALLAAVLPGPSRFRVDQPSVFVRKRALWILKQMHQLGDETYLLKL